MLSRQGKRVTRYNSQGRAKGHEKSDTLIVPLKRGNARGGKGRALWLPSRGQNHHT